MPGVAETMDVEQDNRLPKLDVPNAIQQKVIPGKREGGYVQHKSTSEEIMSPFSPWGNLRDIGQSLQLVWHFGMEKCPCSSPCKGVSLGCCHPRGSHTEGHVPVGRPKGCRSYLGSPQLQGQARKCSRKQREMGHGLCTNSSSLMSICYRWGSYFSPRNKMLFWIIKTIHSGVSHHHKCIKLSSFLQGVILSNFSACSERVFLYK